MNAVPSIGRTLRHQHVLCAQRESAAELARFDRIGRDLQDEAERAVESSAPESSSLMWNLLCAAAFLGGWGLVIYATYRLAPALADFVQQAMEVRP
jgi:hypothetical protein